MQLPNVKFLTPFDKSLEMALISRAKWPQNYLSPKTRLEFAIPGLAPDAKAEIANAYGVGANLGPFLYEGEDFGSKTM